MTSNNQRENNETRNELLKKLILTELQNNLKDTNLESYNLHIIIKQAMEAVEKTHYKGVEQKQFAINLIRELVNIKPDNDEKTAILELINNDTIGNMIDLIVDATKGKLNINKLKSVGFSCFNVCFPLLCMKKNKIKNI